ncbi:hypothetical protein GTE26_003681 [Salmonella enterica]|nr:hypothetical protein [Salmonella enterica]
MVSTCNHRSITYNLLCSNLRLHHGILHKTKEVGCVEKFYSWRFITYLFWC